MDRELDGAIDRLEAALAEIGCSHWLLPPADPAAIDAVVEAVAPFLLPDEVRHLWRRHSGVDIGWGHWWIGWLAPAEALGYWEGFKGIDEGFPDSWPYWSDDHWFPIALHERSTFFVVLRAEPAPRSLVAEHSSQSLDIRVHHSSVRTWVLMLELAIRTFADLGLDPTVRHVSVYDWYDLTHPLQPVAEEGVMLPAALVERVQQDLPRIRALDAGLTWPEPTPTKVDSGDPLVGPWPAALGVDQGATEP